MRSKQAPSGPKISGMFLESREEVAAGAGCPREVLPVPGILSQLLSGATLRGQLLVRGGPIHAPSGRWQSGRPKIKLSEVLPSVWDFVLHFVGLKYLA